MSSENLCGICSIEYNKSNPSVPIHKAINNEFHFTCYECFLKLNNICPFCKHKGNIYQDIYKNNIDEFNNDDIDDDDDNDDDINNNNINIDDYITYFGQIHNNNNNTININNNIYDSCKNNDIYNALRLLNEQNYNQIDYIDEYGNTSLIWACRNGMSEIALKIIKTGLCKLDQIDHYGNTALIFACENSLSKVSLELIKTGQSKPEQINITEDTALIFACKNKLSEVALKLIKTCRSNQNQVNNVGETALFWAYTNDLTEVEIELEK